jgi:ribosomal 50S subunit-recycling heat shock protein
MNSGKLQKRKIKVRLDKYLKISKLIKRRPVATLMCNEGKITIDERIGKASSTVREGQMVEINFGRKKIRAKVLQVPEKLMSGQKPSDLYEIIEELWVQEI